MKEIQVMAVRRGIPPSFFQLVQDPGTGHDYETILFGSDTELDDAWVAQAIVQTFDKKGKLAEIVFLVHEDDFDDFGKFKLNLGDDDEDRETWMRDD